MSTANVMACHLFWRCYSSQVPQSTAVIKLPVYVQKHMEKVQTKEEKWRLEVQKKIIYRGNTSIPVISSNKKEYNYYLGQVYNNKYPLPLMSRYWMKAKSAGQKFTINSIGVNPALPIKIEQPPVLTELPPSESMSHFISEFQQMNLSKTVLEGIKAIGFEYPTPIQALAIPKILRHQHLLCVAETGSGKTMSYMIPIINNLVLCKEKLERFPNTPLALVVVPGRELAEQIALASHRLGVCCGVNVKVLLPEGTKYPFLKARPTDPIDILVAGFGIIYKLAKKRRLFNLSHLQHMVIDEADTMLDDSFIHDLRGLMMRVSMQSSLDYGGPKPPGTQMIFASATMPKNADNVLSDCGVDGHYEKAFSPYIHRILPHIQQKFVRVNRETKNATLLELVKTDFKKQVPVIIFSNHMNTCDWMSHFFENHDIRHVKFHSGLAFQDRAEALEKFNSGDVDVFCCTDLASRGLDTQRARHVINYDFPNNGSDYLLRIGRVGRVGTNHGYVTNMVSSKSTVFTVQDVETAVRRSIQCDNVDANIKKKLNTLYYLE